MASWKPDLTQAQGPVQLAPPPAADSEEAVQLVLEGLRSMGQRLRTASKEQQIQIQATHIQWASMTDAPTSTSEPQTTVHLVGQTYTARQESVHSSLSGLESHVSTLQIEAPSRGFHELTGISDVRELLKGQRAGPVAVASTITSTSTFTSFAAGPPSTLRSPDSDVLNRAIASFFDCSATLFHVFTQEQIADYQNARFSAAASEESRNQATCVVSAVAAVGLQYLPEGADFSLEQSLYATARHYYDLLLEFNPLEAMKVCALFVLYNIFARSTVALAYIEVGLSLCHQFGIDKPPSSYQGNPEQWTEYRGAWRTLLFFSGWLASSLGYVSGDDTVIRALPVSSPQSHNGFFNLALTIYKLSEIELGNPTDITQVAQNELVKISLLKLRIITMQEAFGEHSVLSLASTRSDLQTWYSNLPQALSLASLSQDYLPSYVRKMVYNVQLMYLCATMLLYRRAASHIVRLIRGAQTISLEHQQDELLTYIAEGRDAARHSATLLSTFFAERAFCKRCWLVIYQAYTTCLVLLFSGVQSHADDGQSEAQQQADLEKARQCLEILEWCGSLDHVARQFHRTLSACYEALVTAGMVTPTQENPRGASPFYPGGTHTTTPSSNAANSITKYFSIPPLGDLAFHRHAYKLLDLLCRPFADSDAQPQASWHDDPASGGFDFGPLLSEKMEWNPGSRNLFQWDLAKIGIPATPSQWPDLSSGGAFLVHAAERSVSTTSSNHFVGSMRPSGWETFPSLMRLC
ncbi:ankyrin repeat protein [Apiospora sp. TS-2023a]